MWQVATATAPGTPGAVSEDWHYADRTLLVVLDGATVRTDTGCSHGVHWYATQLGEAITTAARDNQRPLTRVLKDAIEHVAALHPDCDLAHAGTPSAGVAVVRAAGDAVEYLVLGDVTAILDTGQEVRVVADMRIRHTAVDARAEADRWPIGSPEKREALQRMKLQELAARNRPDGYWIAAADPAAAKHAITGSMPTSDIRRLLVVTDGVERLVSLFGAVRDWQQLLKMADSNGPQALIDTVRELEQQDPEGRRYPRNKTSDDATAVYAAVND